MATPVGWSQGGSGSVCLAFDQLRDVIESQEELIHQLRNVMILQDENFVSKEEFQAVEKKLVEEKTAHAKTKVLLAKEEEKLQFALGEVEVLSKQLEKEKLAFEKALSSVKSRALQESSKKDQLITKCNGITCLTSGSRSSKRTTWPKCWTRSIRKPRGRVRPGAASVPGKNKMVAAFLLSGCNAQPLPSLLWRSPSCPSCPYGYSPQASQWPGHQGRGRVKGKTPLPSSLPAFWTTTCQAIPVLRSLRMHLDKSPDPATPLASSLG
ncbi:spermatogenesis-associated protein 24 isoform X2 [Cervus elaphus]|uniref:spermatogenesis-associated protein 24 isoform X2 n=1 Tax=Cervus canadensis TaxID=1574408 RepID=UPI001C9E821F|nr:spermatogenesis-associated protein 24 isoform X2 [Cervus canadensis]XP_043768855.1 spermatogenesis-associated protein 24 isoform X2 [Cervus elaphus]